MNTNILTTTASADYELLDSGNGQKLERFGKIRLVRPDPQAIWLPALLQTEWATADGRFTRSEDVGAWKIKDIVPKEWQVKLDTISFTISPSSFKHVGIFPEQVPNWQWLRKIVSAQTKKTSVLNLFGYTGGATLATAQSGAEVCHVDASKVAVTWARNNAEISGLKDAPIRWIVDDALAFVKREIKRGKKYDAVIMDPPSFGRGPKGEVWKIEDSLSELLKLVKEVLSEKPLFVLINGYAAGYSSIGYSNALSSIFPVHKALQSGELTIEDSKGRLLPSGIFARVEF